MPGLAITPFVPSAQPDPNASGGWFDGLSGIFSWGGGNDTPPAPIPGPNRVLPPPQISQMPPLPTNPSGTSTAWGGPEVMTNAAAAPPIGDNGSGTYGQMPEGQKSYSFMDNPGASDALVAFGAAMLKAPTFNQGLGDAALAVNQVAQKYRMPSESDYARAKQLGIIRNIANGGSYLTGSDGQGGIQVDQKTQYYAPDGTVLWAATDSNGNPGVWDAKNNKFIPGGVPGMQDRRDSIIGSNNRYDAKADSEASQQAFIEAQSAQGFLAQLNELRSVAPTAGIGLDKGTQIARKLTELTGYSFDNIDTSSISTMEAGVRQMALDWSQKMRGQGQVTESERQMIADMMPKAAMDPQAFNRLLGLLERVQQRKIQLANEWFANQQMYRQQYGSFRNFALTRMQELEQSNPTSQPPSGGSTSAPNSGGQRRSLNDIFQ